MFHYDIGGMYTLPSGSYTSTKIVSGEKPLGTFNRNDTTQPYRSLPRLMPFLTYIASGGSSVTFPLALLISDFAIATASSSFIQDVPLNRYGPYDNLASPS